ncbi:unnamed protein product [Sphagnum jensenii]
MGIINTKLFFSDSMEYHAQLFGMHARMDVVGLQAIVHKCVRKQCVCWISPDSLAVGILQKLEPFGRFYFFIKDVSSPASSLSSSTSSRRRTTRVWGGPTSRIG